MKDVKPPSRLNAAIAKVILFLVLGAAALGLLVLGTCLIK